MLDSIEIQQGDKNNINSFSAINQLKQNLKQDTSPNEFKENKKSNNENNPQSPYFSYIFYNLDFYGHNHL